MTALLATAGAFLAQTAAQRFTPPTHTALIFATEPVFAAIFGLVLLGERMNVGAWVGCALILAGMLVAEIPDAGPRQDPTGRGRSPEPAARGSGERPQPPGTPGAPGGQQGEPGN